MAPDNRTDISGKTTVDLDRVSNKLDATRKEATDAARDIRDNFSDALDASLDEHPYTTLLLALGVGFALGALWRL